MGAIRRGWNCPWCLVGGCIARAVVGICRVWLSLVHDCGRRVGWRWSERLFDGIGSPPSPAGVGWGGGRVWGGRASGSEDCGRVGCGVPVASGVRGLSARLAGGCCPGCICCCLECWRVPVWPLVRHNAPVDRLAGRNFGQWLRGRAGRVEWQKRNCPAWQQLLRQS